MPVPAEFLPDHPGNLRRRLFVEAERAGGTCEMLDSPKHPGVGVVGRFMSDDAADPPIIVSYPPRYPFAAPVINGRKPRKWQVDAFPVDIAREWRSQELPVLIAAHPRAVQIQDPADPLDADAYHWWNDNIAAYMRHMSLDIATHPVLSLDINGGDHRAHPDYEANVFSDAFAQQHTGKFHSVFIPDCGDGWWTAGMPVTWVGMIRKAARLVAPGGMLVAGKFIGNTRSQAENAQITAELLSSEFDVIVSETGDQVLPMPDIVTLRVLKK
jgi:hypothetical protein